MIKKNYSKDGKTCRVNFIIPAGIGAKSAYLCGDFTDWKNSCVPMKRRKDGSFAVSAILETGQTYHFRYLLDDVRWENDEAADGYIPNPYGSDDCAITV